MTSIYAMLGYAVLKHFNKQIVTKYLHVQEAARAKQLRAKFEEWEATVGEDGGYTNLVDEDGRPLETASKLKNRY